MCIQDLFHGVCRVGYLVCYDWLACSLAGASVDAEGLEWWSGGVSYNKCRLLLPFTTLAGAEGAILSDFHTLCADFT